MWILTSNDWDAPEYSEEEDLGSAIQGVIDEYGYEYVRTDSIHPEFKELYFNYGDEGVEVNCHFISKAIG